MRRFLPTFQITLYLARVNLPPIAYVQRTVTTQHACYRLAVRFRIRREIWRTTVKYCSRKFQATLRWTAEHITLIGLENSITESTNVQSTRKYFKYCVLSFWSHSVHRLAMYVIRSGGKTNFQNYLLVSESYNQLPIHRFQWLHWFKSWLKSLILVIF